MLVKLNKLLERNIDKILHATISYALTYTLADKFDSNLAVGVAILIGVAKEFFDLYVKKSKFSVGDLVADVAGIVAAMTLIGLSAIGG